MIFIKHEYFFFVISVSLRICLYVFSLTVVNFICLLCIVNVLSCLKIEPLSTVAAAILAANYHKVYKKIYQI